MRALKFITGHLIYNPAYTYKFQLKTTVVYYVTYVLIIRICITYCIAPLAKSEEYLPSPDCTELEEEGSAQSKRVVTFSSRVRWKTSQNSLRN